VHHFANNKKPVPTWNGSRFAWRFLSISSREPVPNGVRHCYEGSGGKNGNGKRHPHDRSSVARLGLAIKLSGPTLLPEMFVRLTKTFHFEAAHDLPTFPEGHKCRRLHGHSFRFDVVVAGEVDPAKGYLIDYGQIKELVDPVVKQLDHYYLNEMPGLSNPTSENLAQWLWQRLKPLLPMLSAINVYETCTSACEYSGR
jgi:6-pyruvoyltetrahydropterin/6-carboxytetrahydropterin synthase